MTYCMIAFVAHAQLPWELPVKPGLWDYPVKPGTEEWKQFKSNEEMDKACQIPEEVLSSLSTEDLTDLCLRYHSLWDFLFYQNKNAGLDKLFNDFNGIRELFKRKDVSSSLSKRYMEKIQSISLLDDKNSDLKIGFFVMSVSVLECLLGRIEHQGNNLKDVLHSLVAGYEEKIKYPDYFMGRGFQTNFFSRAHIIAKMEPSFVERLPQKEKNNAMYSGMVSDEQTVELINELSYQLIK